MGRSAGKQRRRQRHVLQYQLGGVINFQSTGKLGIGNTAPGSLLDVGKAGTTLGTLRLEGSTSGYVQLQPAAAAGSWTATLPATAGVLPARWGSARTPLPTIVKRDRAAATGIWSGTCFRSCRNRAILPIL
jgi:hypothetical protein